MSFAPAGDSPLLSLLRQELLQRNARLLVLALVAQWPLHGASKSLSTSRAHGLFAGVQCAHARFLCSLHRDAEGGDALALDPLLPTAASGHERGLIEELSAFGVCGASELAASLVADVAASATVCARARAALAARPCVNVAGPFTALPVCGTLKLIPLGGGANAIDDTDDDDREVIDTGSVLLIYEPDACNVTSYLEGTRSDVPIPCHVAHLCGTQIMPLSAAVTRDDVAAALTTAHIVVGPFTAVLEVSRTHLDKLWRLYTLHNASARGDICDHTFLRLAFCVLARYEMLFSGNASGLQGALPHHVFSALHATCGIDTECFSSPLNTHCLRYHSAFPDTDAPFGSLGSFFTSPVLRGAYEVNPPFIADTLDAVSTRIIHLLDTATVANAPLLFCVIVPHWVGAPFLSHLASSRFHVASRVLRRKEHEFIDGMQHRTSARAAWSANVESVWFLVASPVALRGLQHPPVLADAIDAAFCTPVW